MPKLFICSNATNELLPETNGSTMEGGGERAGHNVNTRWPEKCLRGRSENLLGKSNSHS